MNISNDVSQAQIASSNVASPSPSVPASAPSRSTVGVGVSSGARSADQATISSASGVLSTALTSSDVRTSKVESLQASINAGTYNVPASSVADKMLSSILGS
ncbi:MAG TPA: flagellar biosynthesis anti-sigma factor FlgM [Granulicella sp.]|nr:flagellar biosynthesis anti-sigma factor FlgM [Granulicella sp.]